MGDLVVGAFVLGGIVRAVILGTMMSPGGRGRRISGVGAGASQSVQVGGLGMLDFGSFDRDSVVDHRDVLGSVPGAVRLGLLVVVSVVFLGSWGVVVLVTLNLGVGGGVFGLGVLDFLGLNWDSLVDHRDMDGSVPGLLGWSVVIPVGGDRSSNGSMASLDGGVSGKVGGLGGSDFRSVSWTIAQIVTGSGRSQQQNGSQHESSHFQITFHYLNLNY